MNQNAFDPETEDIDPSDQQALEIQKRIDDNDKAVMKILRAIFKKPESLLTKDDKAFLQARVSYLTKAQREEYKTVLAEDLHQGGERAAQDDSQPRPLEQMNRVELEEKARELGIPNPEEFANKKAVLEAVKAAL